MTKNERIKELERRVAELERRLGAHEAQSYPAYPYWWVEPWWYRYRPWEPIITSETNSDGITWADGIQTVYTSSLTCEPAPYERLTPYEFPVTAVGT